MLTAFKQICKDLRSFGNSDYKKKVKKCLQQLIMMKFSIEMVTEHHLKKLVDAIPWKSDLKQMVLAKIEGLEKKRPTTSEAPVAKRPSPPVITPIGNGYRIPKKPKVQLASPVDKENFACKPAAPIAPVSIGQETKRTATSEVHVAKETYSPVLAPMNGYRIPKKQPLKPIDNCFSTS
ncbi:hypothetical protein CAEBREN_22938 [Caenorhabditis brenneri]|uniref:Uncharacterized protein n=1 Tax=Caenorhabditis brenneri TaxID=135651 RepID=G0MLU0_CAEBE|nr:hypothetical protein CAEBREN_22938 [Caenorhabditis brenneri]